MGQALQNAFARFTDNPRMVPINSCSDSAGSLDDGIIDISNEMETLGGMYFASLVERIFIPHELDGNLVDPYDYDSGHWAAVVMFNKLRERAPDGQEATEFAVGKIKEFLTDERCNDWGIHEIHNYVYGGNGPLDDIVKCPSNGGLQPDLDTEILALVQLQSAREKRKKDNKVQIVFYEDQFKKVFPRISWTPDERVETLKAENIVIDEELKRIQSRITMIMEQTPYRRRLVTLTKILAACN